MEDIQMTDDFKTSYINGTRNIGQLKAYYEEYQRDCEKLGFVDCNFTRFLVEMAIEGYRHSKETRKGLLK